MKGKLARWNDDKGFGFIRVENEARDIFIHISALNHMGRRPIVGDVIHFDIETDSSGKTRAINASIEGVPRRASSRFGSGILLPLIILSGFFAYDKVSNRFAAGNDSSKPMPVSVKVQKTPRYQCEGKTRCPEMSSCEEANFYLRNCPRTAMDGDSDGIPCEDQWCGH